ncbi:MAG: hypothetical protein WBD16_09585 [Pyrinomonadaceae bacterium]
MSLIELWHSSPAQFENKQVQQIIGFAGDGVLRNQSDASFEFREFLAAIPSELLGEFGRSCLEKPFTNSGFALQDIVNEVGKRLGFNVESGLYQGNRSDIGFDGLWQLPSNHHVVVEVKTTDAYRIDTATTAEYRRRLIEDDRIYEEASSILFVVGREDTGDLEAQIRGSRHAWDVRLISFDSLLRLILLKEGADDPRIVKRICEILIPKEFTRLDHIVDIVFFTTEDAKDESEALDDTVESETPDDTEKKGFKRLGEAVKFNEACAKRFGELHNVALNRISKTTYEAADQRIRIVSLVSRDYEKLSETPDPKKGSFWYGLRDYHKEFIEKPHDGYLILGCGIPDEMLVIPSQNVESWLEQLNTTAKASGITHWHFHLYREGETFYIEPKKGFDRIDVSRFRV